MLIIVTHANGLARAVRRDAEVRLADGPITEFSIHSAGPAEDTETAIEAKKMMRRTGMHLTDIITYQAFRGQVCLKAEASMQ